MAVRVIIPMVATYASVPQDILGQTAKRVCFSRGFTTTKQTSAINEYWSKIENSFPDKKKCNNEKKE